jgi:hypothetical protein
VKVFVNSSGEELYEVPALYLPRSRADITVEFPQLSYSEYITRLGEANDREKDTEESDDGERAGGPS